MICIESQNRDKNFSNPFAIDVAAVTNTICFVIKNIYGEVGGMGYIGLLEDSEEGR